jgi:hypothetical protein
MTNEKKFFAQLSDADWDQAEQIEKDVQAAFAEGWSEETALVFVPAALLIRKKVPDMAVRNVVDLALREGILALAATLYGVDREGLQKPKRANGKSKLVR